MKIVVCIKRVPDTATRIRIAPDGKSIDPSGVEYVVSPYDEIAVEKAIQLKEQLGAGEVIVVSLGPAEASKELRTCLAMGADRAILLKYAGSSFDLDPLSVAEALADAIRPIQPDLVLTGWKAADDDHAQVGQALAVLLDMPCLTFVAKLDVAGRTATVHREVEGAVEEVEASLPIVVTAQRGLAEPRYASLKGIMAAKKKSIEEKEIATRPSRLELRKLAPPPARPPGRIVGQGKDAVPALVDALMNEAKVL
ncbi:MAG: electron transfer flavoprotein subunit beta/FixA family protein [Planctomycetes bacterium]|nr:electron transfer flavoprotein subunit beta/FixA family protein [Planctomycetota bacterium]MBI3843213.1 electron transfer flavoprotein subunit beta/FixA family protein [Planctomycetota bacterium]